MSTGGASYGILKDDKFERGEIDSIYVADDERFVVSLIVSYDPREGVTTPQEAAHYALKLTQDEGSSGTVWFVYDRQEKRHHRFEQSDFEGLPDDYLG